MFGGILIPPNMALHMKNAHIIHHHRDATQLVGFAWSYISNTDYLVVQCWVHASILALESTFLGKPQVHHFIKFFPSGWATHIRVSPIITL